MRNLDPEVFQPQLATNLTLIIQGLIVLLVSAPVIVTTLYKLRPRRPRAGSGTGSVSTATDDPPSRSRAGRAAGAGGCAPVVLGVLAFWLALPPLLVRTPVLSVVLALAAAGAGVWVIREGQRRLGWGAIVCGVLCALGAIAATQSGEANLERVVVWSALTAAMLRFATPLVFAALGGVISSARASSTSGSRG